RLRSAIRAPEDDKVLPPMSCNLTFSSVRCSATVASPPSRTKTRASRKDERRRSTQRLEHVQPPKPWQTLSSAWRSDGAPKAPWRQFSSRQPPSRTKIRASRKDERRRSTQRLEHVQPPKP